MLYLDLAKPMLQLGMSVMLTKKLDQLCEICYQLDQVRYIRNNAFYNESTFNTIIEYVHWKHIVIDPNARKEDMSDAEYMILVDVLPKAKAEKIYDIKTTYEDCIDI